MKLTADQVSEKKKIGRDGTNPVFRVTTKGGLQVIVAIRNGQAEPLAFGPHVAIAKHLARKRCPTLEYTELSKSDDTVDAGSPVVKEYDRLTDALRKSMGW